MDERYKEPGPNYRFFLTWRHAVFAANLVVLYGIGSLCISAYKDAKPMMWLIPLFGSPIGAFLWMIDYRTRDIYRSLVKEGKRLEVPGGGPYTALEDILINDETAKIKKIFSQSIALNFFLIGSSVFLFALGWFFFITIK